MNTLSSNIKLRLHDLGMSQRELAERVGISTVMVHKLVSGKTTKSSKIIDLAHALQCDPDWLLNGNGTIASSQSSNLFIELPIYGDVQLAAGNGNIVSMEAVTDRVPISREWINKNNLNANDLAIVNVTGDSMIPRICDGDMLIIDTSQIQPTTGQVYAIALDNEVRVKRLIKRFDGCWTIHSDNDSAEFPDETLHAEQLHDLRIIGKAIKVLMGDI